MNSDWYPIFIILGLIILLWIMPYFSKPGEKEFTYSNYKERKVSSRRLEENNRQGCSIILWIVLIGYLISLGINK